ncbi:MAG: ABC transporter permease, partial [Treponema sp.]|nr:ABC transporter permease [Treponema sp.]
HKFIIQRLLITIPVLFGITFIVFMIISLTPGDPARLILGMTAPQEAVDMLNEELGYNRPILVRFVDYVYNAVFRLDFGTSYQTNQPVFTEIWLRFPFTLLLAVASVTFSSIIGISLGVIAAVKQYSLTDNFLTVLALFFASIPGFWLGMTLILIFALYLGILPTGGIASWKNFVLPIATLSVGGSGGLLRLTRSTMLEVIRQDYIRTARAKGATTRMVIWNHAMKNALLPVITVMAMAFGGLLGGAVIAETVFSIPGLGTHIVAAIRMKDLPVVMSTTIFLATIFCFIMLVVDILYAFIDPRIKAKYSR